MTLQELYIFIKGCFKTALFAEYDKCTFVNRLMEIDVGLVCIPCSN